MKNKQSYYKKNNYLRLVSIVIILLGIWISADNLYRYSKGYFAYKTTEQAALESQANPNTNINSNTKENTGWEVLSGSARASDSEDITDRKSKEFHTKTTDKELYPVRPESGEEMGELYIPKLNATIPIYEGTDEDQLEKGIGHYAESVLPGEEDNSVLSGHRDTVFRNLREVGENDLLVVRTAVGEFTYKVKKVRIVEKDDRTVIVPKPSATLTVSTCYPFNYIGPAPKRYILVAYLASETIYE